MARSIVILILAAGLGTRLKPYTNHWPKCLMPIGGKPLLEYWLDVAKQLNAAKVLVNTHYLAETVKSFLDRPVFKRWVREVHEPELKGTAGTLRANEKTLRDAIILLVHADNFCQCDFNDFLEFHQTLRPKYCPITMMTFHTQNPSTCGIVEINRDGVVIGFHEKVKNPPGNLANGAVYLLEPEVLQWVCDRPEISDFSTQVLPHFLGRIVTWHNEGIHVDIGSIEALRKLQATVAYEAAAAFDTNDDWLRKFASHPIHDQIKCGITLRIHESQITI
jgi:mannose-1-phosphate guanylyltransferase